MNTQIVPIRRDSSRRRVAVFWAVVEFHQLAREWLKSNPATAAGGCRSQILRSSVRAVTAVNLASAGANPSQQLERVRLAMTNCESAFICLYGTLSTEIVSAALAKIDRILAGVLRLESLDVDRWIEAELDEGNAESSREPSPVISALEQMVSRLRLIVREPGTSTAGDGESAAEGGEIPAQVAPQSAKSGQGSRS